MILVTKKDFISSYINKKWGLKQARILKKEGLLPLYTSSILSKIVGHLIGDGNLSKDKYIGDFRFYGNKNNLGVIKEDIRLLFKIEPKEFYKREGGFVLRFNNCKVSRLLGLVGVPRGNKVAKSFDIPIWIKKGNIDIRKAFIRAICDDEMSSPRLNKKGNFAPLRLKFNKRESILNSGIRFLNNLRNLFLELGVNCSDVKVNNDKYINKNGDVSRSVYINIKTKHDNFMKFYKLINFDDLRKREKLFNLLKIKSFIS